MSIATSGRRKRNRPNQSTSRWRRDAAEQQHCADHDKRLAA